MVSIRASKNQRPSYRPQIVGKTPILKTPMLGALGFGGPPLGAAQVGAGLSNHGNLGLVQAISCGATPQSFQKALIKE